MPVERMDPAVCNDSNKKGGKGEWKVFFNRLMTN
jgi:hypothetical protein